MQIIVDNDAAGVGVYKIRRRQMKQTAGLISTNGKDIGYLDPKAFNRTVGVLLTGGSTPIITKKPEGAVNAICKKAEIELK